MHINKFKRKKTISQHKRLILEAIQKSWLVIQRGMSKNTKDNDLI